MTQDLSRENRVDITSPSYHSGPRTPASPVKWHPIEFLEWFTVLAFICAPLPLVGLHLLQLGHKPHYDFAPVLLLASLVILVSRWREATPQQRQIRGASLLSWSALLLSVAVAFAAWQLTSPWMGTAAWILALASILLRTEVAWKGPWGLLWLILPLPMGFDDWLVQKLQLKASNWSSHILDLLGLIHNLEGNVVRLLDRDLFVDEACSGIMSLVAVLATTAILTVLRRRVLIHALPTILLSGFWAVVMNIARIVICVSAWQTWKVDLLTGVSHEVLGFATFAGAVALALSTEQGVLFFLGPIEFPDVSSWIQVALGNPLVQAWNWLSGAALDVDDDQEDPLPRIPRVTAFGSLFRAGLGVACMIFLLAPFPLVLASESLRKVSLVQEIVELPQDFLPQRIGVWELVGFKVDRRPRADVFGEHSKVWQYEHGDLTAHVSVDFPFHGWHELRACYQGAGWELQQSEIQGADWAGALMKHPVGHSGLLLFSVMDSTGKRLEPLPMPVIEQVATTDFSTRVWQRLQQEVRTAAPAVTTYQIQVLATWTNIEGQPEPGQVIPEKSRQEIQDLFERVKQDLEKLLARQAELEPPPTGTGRRP